MKKILFITHSYSMSGGAEDEFERLLKYFSENKEKYEVHGLFPSGPRAAIYSKYCVRSGIYKYGHLPVIYEEILDYIKYILKSVIQAYQIIRFSIGQKYDLAVINVVVLVWPAIIMKCLGAKVIVFIREDVYPVKLRHFIYKILSKTCDYFIPNSNTKKIDFIETTNSRNIKCIYPGIEEKIELSGKPLAEIIKKNILYKILEKGKFKIVNPAGIFKKKNQILILKALRELKKTNKNDLPYVFFVGYYDVNSSYMKILNDYITRNSLEEFCFFLGPLERSNLYELYKQMDSVILASFSEGMPLVMIESLKFKKPFVSTKVGGVPEIITNSINGFLIDFDEIQLSDVITILMKNKNLYEKIVNKAYLTYKQYFDLNKSLHETEVIFQKLLNG